MRCFLTDAFRTSKAKVCDYEAVFRGPVCIVLNGTGGTLGDQSWEVQIFGLLMSSFFRNLRSATGSTRPDGGVPTSHPRLDGKSAYWRLFAADLATFREHQGAHSRSHHGSGWRHLCVEEYGHPREFQRDIILMIGVWCLQVVAHAGAELSRPRAVPLLLPKVNSEHPIPVFLASRSLTSLG